MDFNHWEQYWKDWNRGKQDWKKSNSMEHQSLEFNCVEMVWKEVEECLKKVDWS